MISVPSQEELIEEAEAALAKLGTPPMPVDPYPLYEALRRVDRVYRSPVLQAYAVTGYAEVSQLAKMPNMKNGGRAATIRREDWEEHDSLRLFLRALVTLDPPEHTALRSLASSVFTPSAIKKLRGSIEKIAEQHLDALAEQASGGAPVDLVKLVASPYPVAVICELLGVPSEKGMLFYELANDWTRVWGGGAYTEEELARADEATKELRGHFEELFRDRRAQPREDLISGLVAEAEAGRLSDEDLMGLSTFLFIAGFETTTNLISTSVWTLLENRDELKRWRENPDITASAVEELIRHGTPISGTVRLAGEPLHIGGHDIPENSLIFLMTAGANRDPAQFPDPDRLDLTRNDGAHVGFGGGAHYCLGANLARMEAQVILPGLINRFSTIEIEGTPQWRTATGLHGFDHLPLVLGE